MSERIRLAVWELERWLCASLAAWMLAMMVRDLPRVVHRVLVTVCRWAQTGQRAAFEKSLRVTNPGLLVLIQEQQGMQSSE